MLCLHKEGARCHEGTPIRNAFATFADPPAFELYDLKDDPIEFHNLAGKPERAAIERKLKAALLAYRRETDDPFLDPAAIEMMIAYAKGETR